MIRVDENDPIGEVELSFPYRDVQIKRNVDPKETYTLDEEIGRGKFGIVYRCTDKTAGLSLAAKFIPTPKKEDRRNVEREIEIMRALQHPRLIQIYDAFENGKTMCVVLELIQGGELFERVIDDDFVLTEKSCTIFMRQICEGVDFIHKQRILHLDMKPENILCLTKTGNRIKIIDFGLARKYDPAKKLQVLFGTPEFVAPEVVNFDAIGYGTDMWSIGVICYVLLSGLSPFMGSTDVQTMANVTIGQYDFDDDAFQNISENAKDFIRKLLVKDMNGRMSAEKCLNHKWLQKKQTLPPRTPSMDMTKDNLKLFVERWNEHPNSPYIFENSTHVILHCHSNFRKDSLESLEGLSPSPCGSIVSDTEEVISPFEEKSFDFDLRRASDSRTCVVKLQDDISERINLAEEIRKLSDKLYQLSQINTNINTDNYIGESSALNGDKTDETIIPIKILDQKYSETTSVPWRKTKHKLNKFSRDVPIAVKHLNPVNLENEGSSRHNSREHTPNETKNLLLKLLEHWDGPQHSKRQNIRHSSISTEWSENEQLGQKTISSLNSFFQSRAANKKLTPFHQFENK